MREFILTLAFVFIILFATPNEIFACKCSNPPTIEESFRDSDAVIYGKVIDLSTDPNGNIRALFQVESSWKGIEIDKTNVQTDATSCGIDFKKGESYFLWLDGAGFNYSTVVCRRHGGEEESFLQNKPKLPLTAVATKHGEMIKIGNGSPENQPKSEDFPTNRDLFLIIGASTTAAVFVLFAVGIIFFIRHKKH